MKLQRQQFTALRNALLQAFPSYPELAMVVREELDENLAAITGGDNLAVITFGLIQWAESRGRVLELLDALQRARPAQTAFERLAAELRAASAPEPPLPTEARPLDRVAARQVLVALYPSNTHAQRVASDAGLDLGQIVLSGTSVNVWNSVLDEAARNDRVDALLAIAAREYPNNPPLKKLLEG